MTEATLRSNSGDHSLTFSVGPRLDWEEEPGLEATVHLSGRHWDGDHDQGLSVEAEGVCLGVRALQELRQALSAWVSLPLAEMDKAPLRGEFPLALAPRQSLTIVFGERQDTVSTTNPVVTITLCVGNLRSEYHYVTDQSCVRLFADALQTALRQVAA